MKTRFLYHAAYGGEIHRAGKARFAWGLKSGGELESMAPELIRIKDVRLAEGARELYPVYQVVGRIRPVRNISDKPIILKK